MIIDTSAILDQIHDCTCGDNYTKSMTMTRTKTNNSVDSTDSGPKAKGFFNSKRKELNPADSASVTDSEFSFSDSLSDSSNSSRTLKKMDSILNESGRWSVNSLEVKATSSPRRKTPGRKRVSFCLKRNETRFIEKRKPYIRKKSFFESFWD